MDVGQSFRGNSGDIASTFIMAIKPVEYCNPLSGEKIPCGSVRYYLGSGIALY